MKYEGMKRSVYYI